ncbi:MAG: excinuclease ABC subunit UvrA [bacterium]|nr:excinuclease ABC subunit UvrA [bacterium]
MEIRGAREHNLRGVDLDLPRSALIVVTGLSGSGKSSLAFDTLYAEGQRRYVESLSAYARQFLDQMAKPDVDSVEGLSPAISIEQRGANKSPRSTVGTTTEIADYLRLLYARAGEPQCPSCGNPISGQTNKEMLDRINALAPRTRVQLLAPVVRGRKGAYKKEVDEFRRKGFVKIRVDGVMLDLADDIRIARTKVHDIDVVVDRFVLKDGIEQRLMESLETALKLGDGMVKVMVGREGAADADEWLLSRNRACVACGVSFPELVPSLFSFNSPNGACPACSGLGVEERFDPARLIPDPTLSLARGAIEPWSRGKAADYYEQVIASLADHYGIDLQKPWNKLPKKARAGILEGTGKPEIAIPGALLKPGRRRRRARADVVRPWLGVVDELERRCEADERAAKTLARYRVASPCAECDGARLGVEGLHTKLGGKTLPELCELPISRLAEELPTLPMNAVQAAVCERILREIEERLRFLVDVGLHYLTLSRPSASLSGGEAQRIRLATQIGSQLMGVLYILDEPSIGLHARDNARLIESLQRLRDMKNTVLVVEHDEATMRAADWVVDMGPGAGIHGGEVVAQGTCDDLMRHPESLTGAYLSGRRAIEVPSKRRKRDGKALVLEGCTEHNLKNVRLEIPLGTFTVVTGVSGSGKSTLINTTLHRALASRLHGARDIPGAFGQLAGLEFVDKVIDVDQSPIGRTPRSNPATYSGAFDAIRKVFAALPEARMRGYGPGRFSFNVAEGRCETCDGDGELRVEMHFLPDLFVPCEVCRGSRYTAETLAVEYRGNSIADVLGMTVEEALDLMENLPSVRRPLEALRDVGLGYIHLGQSSATLSGGEAQRVKLARELAKRSTGSTLYLLDEPTTGLHFMDVEKLLEMLAGLVELGNTVVVIEHNLDVIKTADHVIDLGPEGGEAGGEIVAQGTPEQVARCARSHTGQALASMLGSARA